MGRFLFRTITTDNPHSLDRTRREAIEILADFYLEWREKVDDFKKLTRFIETDESLYNDQAQMTVILDLLAESIVRYEENDGAGLISVIQGMVRELKTSDIPGYDDIYLSIIATFRSHMKSFIDSYDRLGLSQIDNPVSSAEARHLLEESIGLSGLDYEDYETAEEPDMADDFAEFGVYA